MKNAAKSSVRTTSDAIRQELRDSQQRESRRRNRHATGEAQWSDVDAGELLTAIHNITRAGCAIQLGLTKDGGAFVIRIVGDGDPYNEFIRPSEDISTYLHGLSEDFAK